MSLTPVAIFLAIILIPIGLGIGICRALRVREFTLRAVMVLISISVALWPFLRKIVQDEVYGWRTDAKVWVSTVDVKDGTDPETKQPIKVDAEGHLVRIVPLSLDEIKKEEGKWVLAQDPKIEVVNKTTFEFSRWKDALSYGIDLAGGTNLVYELDESQSGGETIDNNLMERMVGAVTKRINPAGTKEIVVRRVGRIRIEVILPGADPAVVEETKELMTRLGTLEFSIVANERRHDAIIRAAKQTTGTDVYVGNKLVAKWRPIAPEKDSQGHDVPNTEFSEGPDIAVRQMAGKPKGFKEILIIY